MKKHYSPSQIAQCCLEHKRGISVQELITKYQIPRSTLYYWFKKYNDLPKNNPDDFIYFKRNYRNIKNNQIKLTHVCEILQKVNCTASAPLKTRLYELEKLYGEYSVHELCSALNVSRGTFYNHMFRNKKEDTLYLQRKLELCNMIRTIYDENHGIYGAEKIFSIIKSKNYRTSLKKVKKLIHEMQLKSIRSGVKKEFMKEQRTNNKYPRVKTRGISYAGEALCYQPPSTRVSRSAICILFLERAIRIIYPQLFPEFIFLQLILYILFYLLSIFSYCIDIVSFAPKFSIPIFEFEIPPLLIYH